MIKINKRHKEIIGLVLIILSFLSIISLLSHDASINPHGVSLNEQAENILGRLGVWVSYYHFQSLGYLSIIFPIIFLIIGYVLFSGKKIFDYKKTIMHVLALGLILSIIFGYIGDLSNIDLFEKYLMALFFLLFLPIH